MVRMGRKSFVRWMLLLACILLPVSALAAEPVVDDAALFTQSEIAQMETIIQSIRDTYQMDAAVLTSSDVPLDGSQDFADEYFRLNGYGLGEDQAGILYLIDMRNRVPHITTHGVMIDYMTDHRIEELLDTVDRYLQRGRYGDSAIAMLNQTAEFLKEGREKGSFRYDAETGERLSGLYNPLTAAEIAVAGAAGLLVCWLFVSSVKHRYTLKGTTYRYDARTNSSLTVDGSTDQYIRETRRRVPRVTHSTGSGGGSGGRSGGGGGGMGSSVHRSSGGGSFGGGTGRKF